MAFEKEAISTPTSAVPSAIPPMMREDRVIEPYAARSPKTLTAASGQSDKGSGAAEPAKTEETVTLSPQMAALARKEQQSRQKEQAIKAREAALEAKAAKLEKLEALEAKLAAKDYSGVEDLVNYDDYTKYLIDKSAGADPQQDAFKALKAEVDGVKKAHQDDVSKRFEAAVADRRQAIVTLVDSNPEFAALKKGGKPIQEAVLQHILDTWEHDDTELTPEQAAKEVKEVLKEKKAQLDALFQEEPAVDQKKELPPLKPGIRTLTNQMTTGELKRPIKSFQGMTDAERYAEARRRAEEKLKAKG